MPVPAEDREHRAAVGARVRAEREFYNLSQETLAAEVGITQQALAKIEGGDKALPVDVLSRLCRTFARHHALYIRDAILDIDRDRFAAA